MKLYIAEKPSVAQQIAESIGGARKNSGFWDTRTGDRVTWAIGHLLELVPPENYDPAFKAWHYHLLPIIPTQFKIQPTTPSARTRLAEIKDIVTQSKPTAIVNACDAGREGELIFRRIWQHLKLQGTTKMERLWLSSMTPEGIRSAITTMKPGSNYDSLAEAAELRAIADWIVGINGTRAATKCLTTEKKDGKPSPWSIGRVQTPTLAMIVDRDERIEKFRNIPFWNVTATFQIPGPKSATYAGTWIDPTWKKDESAPEKTKDRLWKKELATQIADRVKGQKAKATDAVTEKKRYANKLFDLTGLQRYANQQFKWTAAKTLEVAQSLYEEHKAITYPRTEATALPEDYPSECQNILNRLSKQGWADQVGITLAVEKCPTYDKVFNNAAISDHFAIIPTGEPLSGANPDATALYRAIVISFVAVFCPPSRREVIDRTTVVQIPEADTFASKQEKIIDPGWEKLYGAARNDQTGEPLPPVTSLVDTLDAAIIEGTTAPPPHFSESTLLASMNNISRAFDDKALAKATEERGLGTPATRASIIEVLKLRGYIETKNKTQLLATQRGRMLIQELRERDLPEMTKPDMTAEWEILLKRIEKGQAQGVTFSQGITTEIKRIVAKLPVDPSVDQPKQETNFGVVCPNCGKPMIDNGLKVQCPSHNWKDTKTCWVAVSRTIAKRWLKDQEISTLLTTGKVGPLSGFMSKKDKPFSAALKLDTQKKTVTFEFN